MPNNFFHHADIVPPRIALSEIIKRLHAEEVQRLQQPKAQQQQELQQPPQQIASEPQQQQRDQHMEEAPAEGERLWKDLQDRDCSIRRSHTFQCPQAEGQCRLRRWRMAGWCPWSRTASKCRPHIRHRLLSSRQACMSTSRPQKGPGLSTLPGVQYSGGELRVCGRHLVHLCH